MFGSLARFKNAIINWWSERPIADWAIAGFITAGFGLAMKDHIIAGNTAEQRTEIYTTTAAVAAIVGAFGTAAISQYATSSGRRMTYLRVRFGASLRQNWVSLLTSMTAISIFSMGLLIYDRGERLGLPGWIFSELVFLGFLRAVRLIWLFSLLIEVADFDGTYIQNRPDSEDEIW